MFEILPGIEVPLLYDMITMGTCACPCRCICTASNSASKNTSDTDGKSGAEEALG